MRRFFLINYYQSWDSFNNSLVTLITMRFGDFIFFIVLSCVYIINLINLLDLSLYFFLLVITKRAQFPFSGWLPKAISAPTPTSALVHRSTLVLAGLVLLFIYSDIVYSVFFCYLLTLTGFFTIISGSLIAIFEISLKKLVAYRTLSQIGLGIIVFGLGNINLGILNLISHGIAKSLLFMQVGYLIHSNYNQQDGRKLIRNIIFGILRYQLIITLFSLCGLMFTGGMATKEGLLDILFLNNFIFFIRLGLVVRIFLTFFYCFNIYKMIYNINLSLFINYYISFLMIFIISIEIFLVLYFFNWLIINFLIISIGFNYIEFYFLFVVPSLFLFLFVYFCKFIFKYNFIFLFSFFSNLTHYKWFRFIPFSFWLDLINYNINVLFYALNNNFSYIFIKMNFNYYFVFFCLLFLLVFW